MFSLRVWEIIWQHWSSRIFGSIFETVIHKFKQDFFPRSALILLQIQAEVGERCWDLSVTLFWIKHRILLSENILKIRATYFGFESLICRENKRITKYINHGLQISAPETDIKERVWNSCVSNWREDDRKIRKLCHINE